MPESVPGARILERRVETLPGGQKMEVLHWTDPRDERFSRKRVVRRFGGSRDPVAPAPATSMLADRLLVEVLAPENRLSGALEKLDLVVEDRVAFSPVFRVRLPEASIDRYEQILARMRTYSDNGGFRVSPDYLAQPSVIPDDPDYLTDQADLDLIGAPAAWNIWTGSSDVVVAIIDNGIDADHPDLAANLFVNPFEIPANGIDDDHNGLIDDVSGWDFHDNDNLPEAASFHGTAMAGIIGAVGNNATGIAGMAWECRLMSLKAGEFDLPWSAIIQAIDYVISMRQQGVPVTVISNSYGGAIADPEELQSLEAAVGRARDAGLLFVAAAGNNGQDNDDPANPHFYPSDLTLENVLSVAATNNADDLSSLSNYGTTSVDLAAPGSVIYTTNSGGGYLTVSGTSASCARVAGLAALLLSGNPHLDYTQLKQIIADSADISVDLLGKLVHPVRIEAGQAAALALQFPLVDWTGGDDVLVGRQLDAFLLEASAADFDGTIASVAFYANGLLLGTDMDGNDGWSWEWLNPAGEGILQIEVTDNDGRMVLTDGRPFQVLSFFDHWRYGHWGLSFESLSEADAAEDPDRDGLVNIWEYASGGNPLLASCAADITGRPRPVMFTDSGNSLLGFDLRLRTEDSSLELFLQDGNGSLQGGWSTIPADYLDLYADPLYPGFSRVRIGAQLTVEAAPAFLRLGIQLN